MKIPKKNTIKLNDVSWLAVTSGILYKHVSDKSKECLSDVG